MFRNAAIAATLLGAAAVLPAPAQAQGGAACQGRVFIDAVLQNGTGGNNYEYFFHIRNGTGSVVTADVQLQNFPSDVTLFSASLPGIRIEPHATISMVRFGRGTNGNISNATVRVAYDGAAASGPTIRAQNCR
jgi:hypothetical protein